MTGLQSLRLAECSAITNNGMAQLTVLTHLRSLAVICCPRISDRGVGIAAQLPHLTHLNAYGCQKVFETPTILRYPISYYSHATHTPPPPLPPRPPSHCSVGWPGCCLLVWCLLSGHWHRCLAVDLPGLIHLIAHDCQKTISYHTHCPPPPPPPPPRAPHLTVSLEMMLAGLVAWLSSAVPTSLNGV